jgi:hypothetical protein
MISTDSLDLPVVIGADEDPGFVRIKDATWSQLVRSANVRRKALKDLEAETVSYLNALDVLRPVMRRHPTMRVAEALLVLNHQDEEATA